ncbi:MAG: glycosyltransferase family 2 protein [Planctomycetota bacterium]|nr:glycosyltransferase family 2 protein [Planctomycetota bacterium]
MTALGILSIIGLAMVAIPTTIALINITRLPRAPKPGTSDMSDVLVSCCIPARDEEANLEACIRSLLEGGHEHLEILVYDDESTDRTPEILARLAAEDPRIKPVSTHSLPNGWNGKQHACQRMGEAASGEWMLFTDADVRFERDWLRRTLAVAHPRPRLGLLSAFPWELTRSIGEALFVPMIHVLLLSYLPMGGMRKTLQPAASAGCGQFLFARREAWKESGGHAAFKDSMHDGIKMPRAIRTAGWESDLVDGTDLCRCRMYHGFMESFRGFSKNGYEGLGSIWILLLITVIHLVGHLLPFGVLIWCLATGTWLDVATPISIASIALMILLRVTIAIRYRQAPIGVPLHPVAVIATTLMQWWSLLLHLRGTRSWRGRTTSAARD